MKRIAVFAIAFCISFFAVGGIAFAQTTSFEPTFQGQSLPTPIAADKFEAAARAALTKFNWRIGEVTPGVIHSRYEKSGGKIFVEIEICYTANDYQINYIDSKNLDADLEKKRIHRNYVRWIQNLDKEINLQYSR